MSRAQVQQNARDWAAEAKDYGTETLGRLAELAVGGNTPAFRRERAAQSFGHVAAFRAYAIEGIASEADYIDNWLEREDHFGLYDNRTNDYHRIGLGG